MPGITKSPRPLILGYVLVLSSLVIEAYAVPTFIENIFQARFNMVCLQTDDLMKAAMAHMTKSPEPPTFSKL